MQLKTFVINLQDQVKRRQLMSLQLESLGLDFEIIAAIDGRLLSPQEIKQHGHHWESEEPPCNRMYTAPEIGCALTHLGIYKRIVNENIPHALVLEDDVLLSYRLPIILESLCQKIDPRQGMVVLLNHAHVYYKWFSENIYKEHKLYSIRRAHGAQGYFITQCSAKKLLEELYPLKYRADCWNELMKDKIIQVKALIPYCVGYSGLSKDSSIQKNKDKKHRTFSPKIYSLIKLVKKVNYQLFIRPFLRIKRQPIPW